MKENQLNNIKILEVQFEALVASWLRLSRPSGAQAVSPARAPHPMGMEVRCWEILSEALEKYNWPCLRNTVRGKVTQIFCYTRTERMRRREIAYSISWIGMEIRKTVGFSIPSSHVAIFLLPLNLVVDPSAYPNITIFSLYPHLHISYMIYVCTFVCSWENVRNVLIPCLYFYDSLTYISLIL